MTNYKLPLVDWTYDKKDQWCCESALSQSPINIDTLEVDDMTDLGTLQLSYAHTIDAVIDTGYSIQGFATGTANINQRFYTLQQFHFHAHSEHTVDGEHSPLEMHFVHQSQTGRIAVLAVFLDVGEHNNTLDKLLGAIGKSTPTYGVNLYELLPTTSDYYHYLGSLTTPPLTENVEWYVFTEHVTISKEQLNKLCNYHSNNFRDVQPLNDRKVLLKTFKTKNN